MKARENGRNMIMLLHPVTSRAAVFWTFCDFLQFPSLGGHTAEHYKSPIANTQTRVLNVQQMGDQGT